MTRVLSGAALFVATIGAVWFASHAAFLVLAFALLFLAARELMVLALASGVNVAPWPSIAVAGLTLAAWTLDGVADVPQVLGMALLLQLVALGTVSLRRWSGGNDALASAAAALFPSLYLALPIGALVQIRRADGAAALFLLMLSVVVSDTAQYYTGRLAGRTPLAPLISPKKTIEGAIGGFVFGSIALGVIGAWWLPGMSTIPRLLLGVAVVAAGIAGDLFESMLKRSAGVKDSSSLIPGHGGVLDRIDALLFAAPVYYVALHVMRLYP